MRTIATRLACGALYALAVLAFLECSARAALSVPALFKKVAGEDDASRRLRWVRHRSTAPSIYPFDVYHPTRGWALAPGLRNRRVFHGKVLNSSSHGVRGAQEHPYAKPAGRTRILAFGDSFTFGEEVSDDETYCACLETMLVGTEVLNFGVHGYGHDQMLLYLQEEGVRYRPDVVILGFVDWDMERNLLAFRDFAKPRFELRGGRLVLRGTPVPNPEEVLGAEPYRSRLVDLLTMLDQRVRWAVGANDTAKKVLTAAILDEFRKTVEGAGARLVLAFLPVSHEIEAGERPEGESFLAGYCGARGVRFADVRRLAVEQERAGVHLKTAGHWNPREHRLAAEALRNHLIAENITPRPDAVVATAR